MSRALLLISAVTSAGLIAIACTTDYQKGLDDPTYGAPNALAGQQPPPASQQLGSGTDGTSSSGGANASAALCVSTGGALVDGGTCATSFQKDVLGALTTGGCSAVGCHGGPTPANQPKIDTTDATGTYLAFSQYKATNGKPYIDPCSINPTDSVIAFNLDSTAPAASQGTLMPPGGTGLAAAVAPITAWVKCGAPDN